MPVATLLLGLLAAASDTLLVSGSWLLAHHRDPGVVVLHAAMTRTGYDAGHIPGARFAPLGDFHSHEHSDRLPPVERLTAAVRKLGIRNEDRVVIVSDPMGAGILFVVLDYLGHGHRTSVLDGALDAWREAGGTLTKDVLAFEPGTFVANVKADLIVDAQWVASRLASTGVALLDARSEEEFLGTTTAEGLPRYGHIPGAGHLEWSTTFAPDTDTTLTPHQPGYQNARLASRAALRRMFTEAGVGDGDEVVTYCTVGMRASQLYFVSRLLGRKTRLYLGSMADWSARPELPIAAAAP